jgi:hypothetical protein
VGTPLKTCESIPKVACFEGIPKASEDKTLIKENLYMSLIKAILTNGYITLIPIFAWNIIFVSKLPPTYDPKSFNNNIPSFLLIGENLFRTIIFVLPLLFKTNIATTQGKRGLIIYVIGTFLYFTSWLLQMYAPNSLLSKSVFGFAAPAYTPIIWLIGISLLADSYYFNFTYSKWHYILPCIVFSIFHIAHTYLVFLRTN